MSPLKKTIRKKSNVDKSGDLSGHAIGPPPLFRCLGKVACRYLLICLMKCARALSCWNYTSRSFCLAGVFMRTLSSDMKDPSCDPSFYVIFDSFCIPASPFHFDYFILNISLRVYTYSHYIILKSSSTSNMIHKLRVKSLYM